MRKHLLLLVMCMTCAMLFWGCSAGSSNSQTGGETAVEGQEENVMSASDGENSTPTPAPDLNTQTEEPKPDDYKVCFLGNSLIEYGNQAAFLEDIAQNYGIQISVDQITWGGAYLSDYLEETYLPKENVKPRLKQADIVVFQDYGGWQGSETVESIRKLEKWCRKDARFYYYMYDGDDWEMESPDYEELKKLGLQLIPKGQLVDALDEQPYSHEELHLENDFHPNTFNGYLAALVMNSVIFEKKCIDFSKEGLFGEKTQKLSAATQEVTETLRGNSEEEKWEEFQRICKIADQIISGGF